MPQDHLLHGCSTASGVSGPKERTTGFRLGISSACFLHLLALKSAAIGERPEAQRTVALAEDFYSIHWQAARIGREAKSPTTTASPWNLSFTSGANHKLWRYIKTRHHVGNGTIMAIAASLETMQQGDKQDYVCSVAPDKAASACFSTACGLFVVGTSIKACLRSASLEDSSLPSKFQMLGKGSLKAKIGIKGSVETQKLVSEPRQVFDSQSHLTCIRDIRFIESEKFPFAEKHILQAICARQENDITSRNIT